MPKREIEFIDVDTHYEWKPVEGDTLGIKEKILSRDPETKSYTRLLKFPPGIKTAETLVHDFWEEVLIVEGELIDLAKIQTFGAGFYACRPPGMKHGPYHIPRGCTLLKSAITWRKRGRSRKKGPGRLFCCMGMKGIKKKSKTILKNLKVSLIIPKRAEGFNMLIGAMY